jgi:hypothetical protein
MTDSTLQRYNITDEEDSRLAMRSTALYVEPADGAQGGLPRGRPGAKHSDNIRTTGATAHRLT